MSKTKSRNQELADFFLARPGQWIEGRRLKFAGEYAWRTRVSDIRRAPWGLDIRNRVRIGRAVDGSRVKVSEYCYVPAPAAARVSVLHVEASGSAAVSAALGALEQVAREGRLF